MSHLLPACCTKWENRHNKLQLTIQTLFHGKVFRRRQNQRNKKCGQFGYVAFELTLQDKSRRQNVLAPDTIAIAIMIVNVARSWLSEHTRQLTINY